MRAVPGSQRVVTKFILLNLKLAKIDGIPGLLRKLYFSKKNFTFRFIKKNADLNFDSFEPVS